MGGLGRIGSFSFYANKIITTGEGGMLTTDDGALAARCRMLRDHAMPPQKRYWHEEVGFNYRMTNLQAAVGVAQMERIDEFIRRKRRIAELYDAATRRRARRAAAGAAAGLHQCLLDVLDPRASRPTRVTRDELIAALRSRGIDSRPFFHPLDTLPPLPQRLRAAGGRSS